ncbi:hypothetical protein FKW77_010029 [Venturia effusa]|uniref:MYND-type domain-containing protein n=1 Tax=Venturia effusa TaxID=50376 RepID=A0A517L692_9PEZI|nr:hypothetical protein FKW77_010029 [Venturia effusa]
MRDFHLTPFPNEGFCSRCSKLCKKICHKCEDAPSYDGKRQITYYCSVKCQLLDWPAHHGTCRARQARTKLLRVTEVLQAIWYAVRYETFDWELSGITYWEAVTEEDGAVRQLEVPQLELVAKDRDVMEQEDGRREQVVYQRFPDREGEDWIKEELNAALAFGSCQFAVRMLHAPLRKLIDGLYSGTEEICFQPQRCKVNVTRVWVTDTDEHSVEEDKEAPIAEETETTRQPGTLRVVNEESSDNLPDQNEALEADENISLQSSCAGTIGTERTVVHNDVCPRDTNWAAYVHGHDEELEHNETQDFDSTIRLQDFAAQNRRLSQVDGCCSDDGSSDRAALNHEMTTNKGVETQWNSGEDVLGGRELPDDELVHITHDQEIHIPRKEDGYASDWKGDLSENDVQVGAELNDPELQHYGQPGYSGQWLRTSKSLRRSPKKENLHDPMDILYGQRASSSLGLREELFIESEVELGETQLQDLETDNEAGERATIDRDTQDPEQQTPKEAPAEASLNEIQQQEQPRVTEVSSQAALDAYHSALKIRLFNGEIWVFDPTGAQYGYSHSLLPLSDYLVRMKSPPSSVCNHPYGTAKSNIEENVAWRQLRKLGRDVTDDSDFGEQEIRRRLQWGSMDEVIEEAISNVLGLEKGSEGAKNKEQRIKEKEENAADPLRKKPAFKSGPSTNRLSKPIKFPAFRASTSLLKNTTGTKAWPEIGHKRLLRAPAVEHEILLSATLAHLTHLLSLGRESLYTQSSCASRDSRVKLWSIFRALHERFPTPDTEPLRPYKEVKKECKKAIKEIARKEKEDRKRMKKEIKDMRQESKRVVKEYERRQKALLKRVERLMRGGFEVEDDDERWHNFPTLPAGPTNTLGMDHSDSLALDGPGLAAFNNEENDTFGHGALSGEDGIAEGDEMAMEDLGPQFSGLTEGELDALEDFAGHLEWAQRSALVGRLDLLTPSQ